MAFPCTGASTMWYFICATPRSGSTLLCEFLIHSEAAGYPSEWMLSEVRFQAERLGVTRAFEDEGYLAEVAAKSATPNGVFGAKLMWPEMERLQRREIWNIRWPADSVHRAPTGEELRYVYVWRRDTLRQAVSLAIANRTNHWHKIKTDRPSPVSWPVAVVEAELRGPDQRARIIGEMEYCLRQIRRQEAGWAEFFRANRITPFEVTYEDLVAAPTKVTAALLRYLGFTPPAHLDLTRGHLLRMSDERNELLLKAWREPIA